MSDFSDSSDSHRLLFEHHPQPMWVYDLENLRFLAVNDAAVACYGYERDEFLALTIGDIRPPEDVAALRENVRRVTTGRDEAGVWRHRTKDGRIRLVEITSHTLTFAGRPAELVLATDVTERLEAQRLLSAEHEFHLRQYAALMDLMRSQEFQRGDEAAVLREVTEMVSGMIGVERVGVWRLTPARDAIVLSEMFEATPARHSAGARLQAADYPAYFRALEKHAVIEAHDARTDPRTAEFADSYLVPLGITSMLDTPILGDGGVDGVVCLEHVGPARKWTAAERSFAVSVGNAISLLLAQIARARSDERFLTVSRATHDAIWDWDLTTQGVWWSDGFETLFGFGPEEAGATVESWTGRIHPEDVHRVVDGVHRVLDGNQISWADEYRFQRGDGSWAWVLDRGRVIRDATGRAVRMVGGMTDLSERRELEIQLHQSQRMESVGRLAGGIAHDFNNLLTVIRGVTDLNLRRLDGAEGADELRADLREVRDAAERAAGLTRQLLAFSRRQVLEPRALDLNTVVEGLLGMLARLIGEDLRLDFRPSDHLPPVMADPAQMEQVLVNLVVNARDAMPGGGELVIETRNVFLDEAYAAGHQTVRPGPHVMLSVTDTGVGMDEHTRLRCMEPFFTTKAAGVGTGLGLSTVYGIVKQSGGSIWIYSEVGRGTAVKVYLPVWVGAVAEQHLPAPHFEARGSETILVVEDEPALRRLAARILTNAGYRVLSASQGEEALATADAHDGPVHLLLTDVVMPTLSGPELARRFAERSPSTRVLYTSGYTEDAIVREGVQQADFGFLAKPYTVEELTAKVREVLENERPGSVPRRSVGLGQT